MSRYEVLFEKDIDENGYTIRFEALVEDYPYDDEDKEIQADTRERINRGDLVWFCAKVTFIFEGVEYESDSLGGCCYEWYEDFITKDNDYFESMKVVVIEESFKKIRETAAKAAAIEAMLKVSS